MMGLGTQELLILGILAIPVMGGAVLLVLFQSGVLGAKRNRKKDNAPD